MSLNQKGLYSIYLPIILLSKLLTSIEIMVNQKKPENEQLEEASLDTPLSESEYSSKLSEYSSKKASDTENEILKIETQIKNSKDETETQRLEVVLNFLKNKLEIESNNRK